MPFRNLNVNLLNYYYDEKEKIAEGTHERYVVNIARFATRVQAKASGSGSGK